MNRQEFEREVRQRAPRDVEDEFVALVVRVYADREAGPYTKADVQNARASLSGWLYDADRIGADGRDTTDDPVRGLLEKPSGTIMTGEAWDALEPWAEGVRRDLEGRAERSVGLPLSDYEAAVEWIDREEKLAASGPEVNLSDLVERAAAVNEDAGVEVVVQVRRYPVPYAPPGAEWRRQAQGPKGSALWALGKAVDQKADGTPFSPLALVAFVLVDVRTPIVPVSVKTSIHSSGYREVELTVRVPDLSDRDLRTLRDWIRGAWDARGSQALSDKDRAVYVTVRGMGGQEAIDALERGEKREFWEEVRDRLADRGFEYTRYESVQQAWGRLRERVGRWREGEPEVGLEAAP